MKNVQIELENTEIEVLRRGAGFMDPQSDFNGTLEKVNQFKNILSA